MMPETQHDSHASLPSVSYRRPWGKCVENTTKPQRENFAVACGTKTAQPAASHSNHFAASSLSHSCNVAFSAATKTVAATRSHSAIATRSPRDIKATAIRPFGRRLSTTHVSKTNEVTVASHNQKQQCHKIGQRA